MNPRVAGVAGLAPDWSYQVSADLSLALFKIPFNGRQPRVAQANYLPRLSTEYYRGRKAKSGEMRGRTGYEILLSALCLAAASRA
ncbi:hypothetical protein CBM2591_B130077 [Cupriavidus taiwanensis]|nr:hypothetical protein CBM2591_B130077 [Cupriavidus taiwanensis]